ncbi:hypothetical protein ACLBW0_24650 [Enterobacteriaceae bacterium C34A]
MKICFPARKQNGENYATLDEMMGLIGQEPHGSWLAGTNRMWHGGIHLSEKSAPGSVLTAEAMESAVPLQCMAEGEVVAWRLGKDYKKNTYLDQPLQYSDTFVLVKSLCQPDPKNDKTWLEFYTLYMGLAPLSAFKKCRCLVAKTDVRKRKAGKYENSSDGVANVPPKVGTLAKGSRVVILQEGQFRSGTSNQPFGLAQVLDKDGNISGKTFWVTTDEQYMESAGEQYAHLPAWMQHAISLGTFDDVAKPKAAMKINAGDAIGFLGEDVVPAGKGKTSSSHYAHIEVISADSRMPGFLDNPGKLASGRKYIRIHADSPLYISAGNEFKATSNKVGKDIHVILPVDKCNPKKSGDKTYYQTGQNNWVSQDEVDVLNQYDLKELGFSALAEESTPDMSASLKEGWVKKGFQWLEKQVMPERGIQEQQMSQFYKAMHAKLDADKDGELSGQELFAALHHPEMGVRDIVARMVVKHESEWFGGSAHQKWEKFFSTYDVLRLDYAKKWLDDMEWMSKVEPFTSGKAVWHMHPIVFLYALMTEIDCAKLIWGEVVNQKLGKDKACQFRKKVVEICGELWGEERKNEYANSLMACMAVETSRLFTSSVVKLMPKFNSRGDMIVNSKGRAIKEYRPLSRQELSADPNIAARNAVGLIQFTGPAVSQINKAHGLSVTKQQLALMDEIEQLNYVKLYFTSNKKLFDRIKNSDDIYLYIFCPAGVGKNDDFALYSREKDIDEGVNYYEANQSLDSNENGNHGNNDGVIQRSELLTRLNNLKDEGRLYVNKCLCDTESIDLSKEPSGVQWVNRFPTSATISDLLPSFATSVQNFIESIINSGGHVRVSATYRPVERAYLMHYSWKIAKEGMDPASIPPKDGVNIDWTHKGNLTAAAAAAKEMVNGYHIVYGPVLTSRHTQKRAIDMTITNVIGKTLKNAHGVDVLVQSQSKLHEVGATFGVHKLISDPPHWSDDGR